MHKNIGVYKEDLFIDALNNKTFGELGNNLKYMLTQMFGILYDTNIIHAGRVMGFLKPDIYIECRGKKHFVSLKSGASNSVHQEQIKSFILYLREKGISKETQKTILLFQYGDGTLDGSGKVRKDSVDLHYELKDRIAAANEELNANKEFVIEFVLRAIFKGIIDPNTPADYIYHGDISYGVLCSEKQIIKHLMQRSWKSINNLHVGPLMIRPHARYVGRQIESEERRNKVDLDWVNFFRDLDYISNRYDG